MVFLLTKAISTSLVTPKYSIMTAVLCWAGLIVMSSLYVTIPLIPVFSDLFAVTATQAAATSSIFSLGFAAGCLIYGALSDKFGRKRIIFIGLIALTLISLLLGMVHSFVWLVVLRGLQGAAAASFSPVALAYAVEMFPAHKRVTTIGFISTGFLVAGIVGQVLSGYVSEHYDWNTIFYLLSILYAVTTLLVLKFLPKGTVQSAGSSLLAPFKNIGKVLVQKNLLLAYLAAFVLLMSFVSMSTLLGIYLGGTAFELDKQEILYIRSFGIVGMLLSPFAGKLSERFGTLVVLRVSLCIAIAGLASLGLMPSLASIVVMSILFTAGIALAVPSLISLVGKLGGKARGIAVSVYTFILFAGTSLGPVISFQFLKTNSFPLAFILLALVLGIGLLAACLIRDES